MAGRPRAIDQALAPTSPKSEAKRFVTLGVAKPRETARTAIRKLVGPAGEELWKTLYSISRGDAWVPVLPDGREGPPQIPSSDDRLAAAKFLAEMFIGKAVPQTQVLEAEKAGQDLAELENLSDADLLLEAKEAFNVLAAGEPEKEPSE